MKLPRLTGKHPEDTYQSPGCVVLRVVGREIKRWKVGGNRIITLDLAPDEARLLKAGLESALEDRRCPRR